MRKVWLFSPLKGFRIRYISGHRDGALPNWTQVHYVFALKEAKTPQLLDLRQYVREFGYRNSPQDSMVGNIGDDALLDYLATKRLDDTHETGFGQLPTGIALAKPQFHFKGHDLLSVRNSLLPVFDKTCIADTILGISGADSVQMDEGVFQGSQTARKRHLGILLPAPEEALQYLKAMLIRHDEEELALQLFLWVFLIFETIIGCDAVELEFSEPLQALDLSHGLDEVLDWPNRFQHQRLLWRETCGAVLHDSSLDAVELRSQTSSLALCIWYSWRPPTSVTPCFFSARRFWEDQKRMSRHSYLPPSRPTYSFSVNRFFH